MKRGMFVAIIRVLYDVTMELFLKHVEDLVNDCIDLDLSLVQF